MSDDHHLVRLNNLFQEDRDRLDVMFPTRVAHRVQEELVVGLRKRDSRKQIGCDAAEKWNIVR